MKKIIYICDWCNFSSEFLGQDIWEVFVPVGWSGKYSPAHEKETEENHKPHKLIVSQKYTCLKCGVKIYKLLLDLEEEGIHK